MKIAIYTLGCKVNQYETQAMEQELRRRGHQVVPFEEAADAYVVNSCSVTAVSDRKSRQMLHRIRREHPYFESCNVICCSDAHYLEDIHEPEHQLYADSREIPDILKALERHRR